MLLGGEVEQVWQAPDITRDTVRVATQGVLIGIGLSGLATLAAAAGSARCARSAQQLRNSVKADTPANPKHLAGEDVRIVRIP